MINLGEVSLTLLSLHEPGPLQILFRLFPMRCAYRGSEIVAIYLFLSFVIPFPVFHSQFWFKSPVFFLSVAIMKNIIMPDPPSHIMSVVSPSTRKVTPRVEKSTSTLASSFV
jgi:hypothetical protein